MTSKISDNGGTNNWPLQLTTTPVFNDKNKKHMETCSDKTCNKKSCAKNNSNCNSALTISIASFNILAESYLSPRSHPNLPEEYASVVFDPDQRRDLLLKTLKKLIQCSWTGSTKKCEDSSTCTLDILCLQEVDMYDDLIEPFMTKHGYDSFKSNNSGKKVDSCAVFWKKDVFDCIKKRSLDFDDLATLELSIDNDNGQSCHTNPTTCKAKNKIPEDDDFNDNSDHFYGQSAPSWDAYINSYPTNAKSYYNKKKKKTQYRKQKSPSSLTGILQSFSRRNTSCLLLLKPKNQSSQKDVPAIAVACAHLYWNPGYEYVKLAQSKYLMRELKSFTDTKSHGSEVPVIICGDMNSTPGSTVYRFYLEENGVDARKTTPWFTYLAESSSDDKFQSKSNECNQIEKRLKRFGSNETQNEAKKCASHHQNLTNINKLPDCCNGNSKCSMNDKEETKCNESSCKKNSYIDKSDGIIHESNAGTCCENNACCGENESESIDYQEKVSCTTNGTSECCSGGTCHMYDDKEEIHDDPNNERHNTKCCESKTEPSMDSSKCCGKDEDQKYEIDRENKNDEMKRSSKENSKSSNEQSIVDHAIATVSKKIPQRNLDSTDEMHDCCNGDSECCGTKTEKNCDESTHEINSCCQKSDDNNCGRLAQYVDNKTSCCNGEIQKEPNISFDHQNSVANEKCGASDEMQLQANTYEYNQSRITETTEKMKALSIYNSERSNTECCGTNESQTSVHKDQQRTKDKYECCNGSFDCDSRENNEKCNNSSFLKNSNDSESKTKTKNCNEHIQCCGTDESQANKGKCADPEKCAIETTDEKYDHCNGGFDYHSDEDETCNNSPHLEQPIKSVSNRNSVKCCESTQCCGNDETDIEATAHVDQDRSTQTPTDKKLECSSGSSEHVCCGNDETDIVATAHVDQERSAQTPTDKKLECRSRSFEHVYSLKDGRDCSGSGCESHSLKCSERRNNNKLQNDSSTCVNYDLNVTNTTNGVNDCCNGTKAKNNMEKNKNQRNRQIRYLLDFSLNKFTRWLRMLGIDAELETEEEEEERTRSLARRM